MSLKLLFLSILFGVVVGTQPPNIILIIADDLGWSETSVLMNGSPRSGDPYIETPNLELLANTGIRYKSGYSPASVCTPSRRAIMNGVTAVRSGSSFHPRLGWVPHDHITIPKALSATDSRYVSAHFGKWGEKFGSTPEQCGFDVSDGPTGNIDGGIPKNPEAVWMNEGHYIDNLDPKQTSSITNRSISFIETNSEQPFYLQVSYYAVHLNVACKQETFAKYDAKGLPPKRYSAAFAAMTEEMDTGIGRILKTLERLDIRDNTYIVFTSDNGARNVIPGGNPAGKRTNFPLSGAKHVYSEGGIRVPFIINGPTVDANIISDTVVTGYDLLKSFVEIAGGDPEIIEGDGVSIVPTFSSRKVRFNRSLFFTTSIPRMKPNKKNTAVIRDQKFKLNMGYNTDRNAISINRLFRLNNNPRENDDRLVLDRQDKIDEMQKTFLNYMNSIYGSEYGWTR